MGSNARGFETDRHANLLISLLVRYPEISSVHISSSEAELELVFLFHNALEEAALASLEERLRTFLGALSRLDGVPRRLDVRHGSHGGVTRLVIARDLASLVAEEFAIIVSVVKERFGEILSVDEKGESALTGTDDEETIVDTLEELRKRLPERELIVIRDQGRVLVFSGAEP